MIKKQERERYRVVQQGMVYLPKDAPWVGPLIAELLRFPNGTHDDQVDALAWLGLMMTELLLIKLR